MKQVENSNYGGTLAEAKTDKSFPFSQFFIKHFSPLHSFDRNHNGGHPKQTFKQTNFPVILKSYS